jgi:hypothetical protein
MGRPVQTSVTGVAASDPVALSTIIDPPFQVTLAAKGGAGCTYTIQFTLDNVQSSSYNPSTGTWIDHPDATSQTGNCAVMLVSPVTAVRLNQTVGSNTTVFYVCQSGNMG